MIHYYLSKSGLTAEPDDLVARTTPRAVLTLDDLVTQMGDHGTTVTRPDILATLDLFFEKLGKAMAEGNHVNLPIASFRPSISGLFEGKEAEFNPAIHTRHVRISTGPQLSRLIRSAPVQRVRAPVAGPVLETFYDFGTRSTDSTVTPGGSARLHGDALKFDATVSQDGIIFINTADKTETKVDIVMIRTDGRLLFMVPDGLVPGTYTLEVRRSYTKDLKLRKGTLLDKLTVA